MAKRKIKRSRRIKPRFFVFIGIIVIIAVLVIWSVLGGATKTAAVQWGQLGSTHSAKAVLLRDEQVISAESYGKIIYFAAEGERVAKDAKIAEVFRPQFTDKDLQEYYTAQQAVLKQQQTLMQDIVNEDLTKVSDQVDAQFTEIEAMVRSGDVTSSLRLERALNSALQERHTTYRNLITEDDTLTQLYAQEDALQSKVDQAKTEVVAPYSGVVSFYLDGRESLLNPESMAELTYETVETVTKDAKAKGSTDANPQMPLFRVVNNAKWYVLILSDGGAVELNAGQSVNLNFSGYAGVDYAGTCTDVRPSGDNALYVIEMSQDIGALLSERNLDVTVGKQMEGLKIPASALQTQEGVRGVYVIDGQAKTFVPVKVLVEDGSAAIVEALGSENQLEVNQLVQIK